MKPKDFSFNIYASHIILFLATFLVFRTSAQSWSYRILENFEILEDEDRRDILKDIRTSYIPENISEGMQYQPYIYRYPRWSADKYDRRSVTPIDSNQTAEGLRLSGFNTHCVTDEKRVPKILDILTRKEKNKSDKSKDVEKSGPKKISSFVSNYDDYGDQTSNEEKEVKANQPDRMKISQTIKDYLLKTNNNEINKLKELKEIEMIDWDHVFDILKSLKAEVVTVLPSKLSSDKPRYVILIDHVIHNSSDDLNLEQNEESEENLSTSTSSSFITNNNSKTDYTTRIQPKSGNVAIDFPTFSIILNYKSSQKGDIPVTANYNATGKPAVIDNPTITTQSSIVPKFSKPFQIKLSTESAPRQENQTNDKENLIKKLLLSLLLGSKDISITIPKHTKDNQDSNSNIQTELPNENSLPASAPQSTTQETTRPPVNNTTGQNMSNVVFRSFWSNNLDAKQVRQLQGQIMKLYMNSSADPCENFFNYACGNWKRYYTIPPDRASYDTFEMLRENLDVMLRGLLTNYMATDNEQAVTHNLKHYEFQEGHLNESGMFDDEHHNDLRSASEKAKQFYKSCMNEQLLKQRGDKPLRDILKHLGGWPVLDPNWNERDFDIVWVLAQLKLFNNDVLISEWVGPDIKNSESYVIQIDQTSLGLPTRDYFLDMSNWKYVDAYKDFMITTLNLLGTETNQALKVADELIQFETKLAETMDSPTDRKNVSAIYLRTNIGTLSAYFPQFDWLRYFTMVLGKKMSPYDHVVCYCLTYLHKLVELLSNTRQDVIANYVLWRFVRHRTNNLDERYLHAKQKFYYILFGREKNPPRWQFCVSQVNSNMGMAVGSLFVKKYFDENSKNDTLEITRKLQESFRNLLDQNRWIDDDTKSYAKKKIDKMNLKIGYPNFLLDPDQLNKRYSDVEVHPDYFFENVMSLLRHNARAEQERIGTIVNKTLWGTPPAVVNAYYSRNKNQIMFPAGILQPPFYHRFFPKALNFGGIGVVIGHEITHGFDDKGRLFDADGNLEKWWRADSIKQFHERAQCIIDQYNSYIMPVIHVQIDGSLTQGENIADNGGLKQSFKAYKRWLADNPKAEEFLPGMNLTGEQLFFLNFAQVWCGMQRPESAKSRLKTAVHSPGLFRVIGTVSNSEDFARVYKCSKDTPMNPNTKCVLW